METEVSLQISISGNLHLNIEREGVGGVICCCIATQALPKPRPPRPSPPKKFQYPSPHHLPLLSI